LLSAVADKVFFWIAVILILTQVISSSALSQERYKDLPVTIHMTDEMKFVPDRITVRVGQKVDWINDAEPGGPSHTITTDPDKAMDPKHVSSPAGAEVFDSGNIKPGKAYTHIFKVAGVYEYVCAPHEGMMRGEITVEP
jgi:plastocyanin